ncbi:hypothetical protein SASPL_150231 [Salvia splendens]|uniref:Benzyl alcohol O-benzoyltransferase n=1 Tax=Salvia splendens TaxID=180675 RepID=A0A8X8W671_SALSN|nr:hypothetical protein SASPL_150231 [Salvia splendens]
MEGKDPVKIIRDAIAKALVFYYPLAGRLREHTGRRLVVECTGQGVLFSEADADLTLQHFGEDDALYPPFPNLDDITLDVPNKLGMLGDIPLMLIQMVERSFYFSSAQISALRRSLPPHLQHCSKFDIVAGCVWRCQIIALSPNPDEEIRFSVVTDNRKQINPPLPIGYYGNVIAFPVAVTTAGELSKNPLHYAVELVMKAKREAATGDYLRSVVGLMVRRDRPNSTAANTYMVSNLMHVGFKQMDVGWGPAAYGGVSKGIYWAAGNIQVAWYLGYNDGFVVPVCLPIKSIKVFEKHLQVMMTTAPTASSS